MRVHIAIRISLPDIDLFPISTEKNAFYTTPIARTLLTVSWNFAYIEIACGHVDIKTKLYAYARYRERVLIAAIIIMREEKRRKPDFYELVVQLTGRKWTYIRVLSACEKYSLVCSTHVLWPRLTYFDDKRF